MTPGAVCLDVRESLAGRTWRYRCGEEDQVLALAQRHGFPEPLARVLAGRGFDEAVADRHFDASLKAWMPDPSSLHAAIRTCAKLAMRPEPA